MFERNFVDIADEDLEGMAQLVNEGAISRDDYRRLCRWLIGAICTLDAVPDPTLMILEEGTGRVTNVRVVLLRIAFYNWRVVFQTFFPEGIETHPKLYRLFDSGGKYQVFPF